mmetsp:Transcript_168743/g.542302  ORF Transcript_168743/g.542302 Transcript_168743/m.542302 type:complete len:221 (+) Transcript_168743:256-918(+)
MVVLWLSSTARSTIGDRSGNRTAQHTARMVRLSCQHIDASARTSYEPYMANSQSRCSTSRTTSQSLRPMPLEQSPSGMLSLPKRTGSQWRLTRAPCFDLISRRVPSEWSALTASSQFSFPPSRCEGKLRCSSLIFVSISKQPMTSWLLSKNQSRSEPMTSLQRRGRCSWAFHLALTLVQFMLLFICRMSSTMHLLFWARRCPSYLTAVLIMLGAPRKFLW